MTRKAGQDAGVTRQRLLDVSLAHFAEKGYEGVSLRSVCADADVTTGALYFFFKNKEDLFRQVITPLTEEILSKTRELQERDWDDLIADQDGGLDRAAAMSHELIEVCAGHSEAMRAIRCNRDTAPVREFVDELSKIGDAQMQTMLETSACSEASKRVLSSACTELFLEVLLNGGTREETEECIIDVLKFIKGGALTLDSLPK